MFNIHRLDRAGSTNDEARKLADGGAPHGTVVHADEQAAGRGRLGRTWFSPPGNLYVSVLLRLDLPVARAAELSFLAALSVADTVDALLPKQTRASLKWPNDVLVNGGKIAGILVEHIAGGQIIGIGLNILHGPRDAPYRTATLVASGGIATVEGARDILLDRLARHLGIWSDQGFAAIRGAWLVRAHPVGAKLRVNLTEGTFGGLDADGALLLDTPEGRQRVVSGDVSF